MFSKKDIVKIKFDTFKKSINTMSISKKEKSNLLQQIEKFDKEYDHKHTITNIFINKAYTTQEHNRYELDNKYVFYDYELIK